MRTLVPALPGGDRQARGAGDGARLRRSVRRAGARPRRRGGGPRAVRHRRSASLRPARQSLPWPRRSRLARQRPAVRGARARRGGYWPRSDRCIPTSGRSRTRLAGGAGARLPALRRQAPPRNRDHDPQHRLPGPFSELDLRRARICPRTRSPSTASNISVASAFSRRACGYPTASRPFRRPMRGKS